MRHAWLPSLTLALSLAACQTPATKPLKAAAAASAAPATRASSAAAAKPMPKANLLAIAKDASVTLAGSVAIEGAYLLRAKAGRLVADGGAGVLVAGDARVISNDGSSVISNDGSSVISNDGSSIISQDGGSVISNDGSSLISQDGGSLIAAKGGNMVVPGSVLGADGTGLIAKEGSQVISNDGSSVISNDDSSVISNDGSSLISQDGGSYGLLSTAGATAAAGVTAIAEGQLLPAAGMAVCVRSLSTGKLLPIGTDSAGKPAYAIYTDLSGKYKLGLSGVDAGDVEVVAQVPGQTNARLRYQRLEVATSNDEATIDADTACVLSDLRDLVATFTLAVFSGDAAQIEHAMRLDELGTPDPNHPNQGVSAADGILAGIKDELGQMAKAAHDHGWPGASQDVLKAQSYVLADRLVGWASLETAPPILTYEDPRYEEARAQFTFGGNPEIQKSALNVLAYILADRRKAMAQRFEDLGAATATTQLSQVDEVKFLNQQDHTTYTIQRASDYPLLLGRLMVIFQADSPSLLQHVKDLEAQLGVKTNPGEAEWFAAGLKGLLYQAGTTGIAPADQGGHLEDVVHFLEQGPPAAKR